MSGGQDMSIDDRAFNMFAVQTMDVAASLAYLYPRLVPLLDALPSPVRCTEDELRDDGVYVLDNGIHMFLWIGLSVSPDWIHDVFGTNSQIDRLAELDNPRSKEVSCPFWFLCLDNFLIVLLFRWGTRSRNCVRSANVTCVSLWSDPEIKSKLFFVNFWSKTHTVTPIQVTTISSSRRTRKFVIYWFIILINIFPPLFVRPVKKDIWIIIECLLVGRNLQ